MKRQCNWMQQFAHKRWHLQLPHHHHMRIGQHLSPDPPVYPVSPVYILSTPSKKSPLASALRCNSTPEIGGISEDEFACESIRPACNDVDDVVLAGVDGSLLCLQAFFNELGLVDRSDLQCAMKCKTYAEVVLANPAA